MLLVFDMLPLEPFQFPLLLDPLKLDLDPVPLGPDTLSLNPHPLSLDPDPLSLDLLKNIIGSFKYFVFVYFVVVDSWSHLAHKIEEILQKRTFS